MTEVVKKTPRKTARQLKVKELSFVSLLSEVQPRAGGRKNIKRVLNIYWTTLVEIVLHTFTKLLLPSVVNCSRLVYTLFNGRILSANVKTHDCLFVRKMDSNSVLKHLLFSDK